MSLSEEQRAEVAALAQVAELSTRDRGRLMALRHFYDPDRADADRIEQALAARPPAPAESSAGGADGEEGTEPTAAQARQERFEAQAERALTRVGVRPERLAQAVRMLRVDADPNDSPEYLQRAAGWLRTDIPDLFEPTPPAPGTPTPAPGSTPGRGVARGREKAAELGWTRT